MKLKPKERIILDVECYKNYFLAMFRRVKTGQVIYFESFNDSPIDTRSIHNLLNKYTVVTFNGIKYDQLIVEAALSGFNNETLYKISQFIIEKRKQPWEVRKQFGFTKMDWDHIDILEPLPIRATLKIYGGRIHAPKIQDLPVDPHALIKNSQRKPMRTYCANDLELTQLVMEEIETELWLRETMSEEYKVDVRSKSDAQVAEAVIRHELQTQFDINPQRPKIPTGTEYFYRPPAYLSFESEILRGVFKDFVNNPFTVNKGGHVDLPEPLKKRKFVFGNTPYKIGVGGLHSAEKSTMHESDDEYILRDYDVASYYPNIILINKYYPKHLGKPFLRVYQSIVARRLKAKANEKKAKLAGDTKQQKYFHAINESLKITINGSFGKLASKWSFLYSPDLMMQVTVTGQLSLFMLIEWIEKINGAQVVSANTDGIVVKMKRSVEKKVDNLVSDWEFETGYEMEATDYMKLCSRDVNNYIAIKDKKSEPKSKGAYAEPNLKINPSTDICTEAVKMFLRDGKDIEETIRECDDVRKFLVLRTVNGEAEQHGEIIGKAIRWYYSSEEMDAIYYHTNGNKVPMSDGGRPMMQLKKGIPRDMDYDWYVEKAHKILKEIGYKGVA